MPNLATIVWCLLACVCIGVLGLVMVGRLIEANDKDGRW